MKKAESTNGEGGVEQNTGNSDPDYCHYDQYEDGSDLRKRRSQFHESRSQPSMNSERGCPDGGSHLLLIEQRFAVETLIHFMRFSIMHDNVTYDNVASFFQM